MGAIASQITSLTIVYSIVYSDGDQRKHQSSASLAFVRGIHRGPVNFPHKWPVTRKMFPFDDVIMQMDKYGIIPHQYKLHISWQRHDMETFPVFPVNEAEASNKFEGDSTILTTNLFAWRFKKGLSRFVGFWLCKRTTICLPSKCHQRHQTHITNRFIPFTCRYAYKYEKITNYWSVVGCILPNIASN